MHARMLAALCAALAVTMAMAGVAQAGSSVVRVETPSFASSFTTLVDRTPAPWPTAPVTVTDKTDPSITATCAPDSAASLLTQVVGASGWDATVTPGVDPTPTTVQATRIKTTAQSTTSTPTWDWVVFLGDRFSKDLCNAPVPDNGEALFYPLCRTPTPVQQNGCFTGGALLIRIGTSGYYETNPWIVPSGRAPVSVSVTEAAIDRASMTANTAGSRDTTVTTDEGSSGVSNDDRGYGIALVDFFTLGPHTVRAYEPGKVPVRMAVCSTDGQDGYCGTSVPDHNEIVNPPSPCTTNGHDGECGTQDTSGPPTHITNIKQKQVFTTKKAPTGVVGTIDTDRNGVKDVQVRLTRVSTVKIPIKAKKPKHKTKGKKKKKAKVRYRTVKRCTYFSDDTLLFEKAKGCGAKYGTWFEAIVDDVPTAFHYDFALRLPAGTYTLETQSHDGNGFPEDAEAGRNVLTFTVR